jgi:hypothetical protein
MIHPIGRSATTARRPTAAQLWAVSGRGHAKHQDFRVRDPRRAVRPGPAETRRHRLSVPNTCQVWRHPGSRGPPPRAVSAHRWAVNRAARGGHFRSIFTMVSSHSATCSHLASAAASASAVLEVGPHPHQRVLVVVEAGSKSTGSVSRCQPSRHLTCRSRFAFTAQGGHSLSLVDPHGRSMLRGLELNESTERAFVRRRHRILVARSLERGSPYCSW